MKHRTTVILRWLLAFLLFSVPASAQAGWFSYDNYEGCMLGRTKGQDQSMYLTAAKLCQREFKVEFSLQIGGMGWIICLRNKGDNVEKIRREIQGSRRRAETHLLELKEFKVS